MTAAGSYRPEPLTDADRAANDEAARRAVALLHAMDASRGRPLSAELRSQMRRAERRARGLVDWDRKRGRA